jgi:hypothetical protein
VHLAFQLPFGTCEWKLIRHGLLPCR